MSLPAAGGRYINKEEKSTISRKYPCTPVEAGMARSQNPTYVSYTGDGTGRDSYIILNNGGLTREPKEHMMWSSKIMSPRV